MASALGLAIAVMVWILAIRAIAWSFDRQVAAVAAAGLPVEDRFRRISMKEVARYHTLGWTAAIFIFFVLLELAAFPLWQLLGFAGLLSLVYGTSAVARGESEWIGKDDAENVAVFGPVKDAIWYRMLMIIEWAAYLVSIVFGANLLSGVIT